MFWYIYYILFIYSILDVLFTQKTRARWLYLSFLSLSKILGVIFTIITKTNIIKHLVQAHTHRPCPKNTLPTHSQARYAHTNLCHYLLPLSPPHPLRHKDTFNSFLTGHKVTLKIFETKHDIFYMADIWSLSNMDPEILPGEATTGGCMGLYQQQIAWVVEFHKKANSCFDGVWYIWEEKI